MLKAFLAKPYTAWTFTLSLLALTAVCILKMPDIILLKRISAYAIPVMLSQLGLGLLFLIFGQRQLMLTSFACCAALCLHFKSVANINLVTPAKTSEQSVTIVQVNTGDLAGDWQSLREALLTSGADVITIGELTPDWQQIVLTELLREYPYQVILTRIDLLGVAICSKFPVGYADTLVFEEVPHLRVNLEVPGQPPIDLYTFGTNPPLFRSSLIQLRRQLALLSEEIRLRSIGAIATGNYNLDQFADEVQDFRASARMLDSRRSLSPTLTPPTNHIFYTADLECLKFQNLYDRQSNRMGIMGEYQFRRL